MLKVGAGAGRQYHGEISAEGAYEVRDDDFILPKRLYEVQLVGSDGTARNVTEAGEETDSQDSIVRDQLGSMGGNLRKEVDLEVAGEHAEHEQTETEIQENSLGEQLPDGETGVSGDGIAGAQSDIDSRPRAMFVPLTVGREDSYETSNPSLSAEELWPRIGENWQEFDDENFRQSFNDPESSVFEQSPEVQSALDEGKMSREIHVIGMGAVGKFVAHGLASLPNPPPITLLVQRPLLMQKWHQEGAAIHLYKKGRLYTRTGFNLESAGSYERVHELQRFPGFGSALQHTAEPPETVITTLIVTTAPKVTIPALMAVRHRLRPSSTICIIQDGMGIVEDLNTVVFPDAHRRPTYVLGSIAQKKQLETSDERAFTITQKGDVQITCSKLPREYITLATADTPSITRKDFSWSLPAAYVVASLARVPDFHTHTVGHKSFYRLQLRRLAAHAVIGPVSVLFDCAMGELLESHNARLTIQSILSEISVIIRSMPELESLAHIDKDFSTPRLENMVRNVLRASEDVVSPMLQHVRAGRRTDVDYYCGYLLTRATELGIPCPRIEMLLRVVKAKQSIKNRALEYRLPYHMDY